jgi:group I intron endonuclease
MVEEEIIKYGFPVIYKIVSPSGNIYIGQSRNWVSRRSKYKKLRCEEQTGIYRSLIKYGFEQHTIEIIEELPLDITQEELNNKEIFYWRYYKELGVKMLNVRECGSKGKASLETKKKMSISQSGKNNAMFGKFGKDHPGFGQIGYWKGKKGKDAPRYGTIGELSPNFGRTGDKHPMFGLRKGKSPFAKKVLNLRTTEIYDSAKDAAEILNISYPVLTDYLRKKESGRVFRSKYSLEYFKN